MAVLVMLRAGVLSQGCTHRTHLSFMSVLWIQWACTEHALRHALTSVQLVFAARACTCAVKTPLKHLILSDRLIRYLSNVQGGQL